jgi:adenylate kinase
MSRYDTYMDITKPILEFYSSKDCFIEIDGSLKIDQITSKITDIIDV